MILMQAGGVNKNSPSGAIFRAVGPEQSAPLHPPAGDPVLVFQNHLHGSQFITDLIRQGPVLFRPGLVA